MKEALRVTRAPPPSGVSRAPPSGVSAIGDQPHRDDRLRAKGLQQEGLDVRL